MRYLIIAALLTLPVLLLAQSGASPPPVSGGWGDCTNWMTYSVPWASGELCYDPDLGAGGEGFKDCATGAAVIWPGLDIELWIEMECILTWDRTEVDIHKMSDYAPFYLYFNGTSACNNGQVIITTPPDALGSLAVLPFVEDMFGRSGSDYGTDIPLTWEYSLGGAAYLSMDPGTGGAMQFSVPLCDQFFTIRVLVGQVYHQEDGYYHLGGEGASICPATPL